MRRHGASRLPTILILNNHILRDRYSAAKLGTQSRAVRIHVDKPDVTAWEDKCATLSDFASLHVLSDACLSISFWVAQVSSSLFTNPGHGPIRYFHPRHRTPLALGKNNPEILSRTSGCAARVTELQAIAMNIGRLDRSALMTSVYELAAVSEAFGLIVDPPDLPRKVPSHLWAGPLIMIRVRE